MENLQAPGAVERGGSKWSPCPVCLMPRTRPKDVGSSMGLTFPHPLAVWGQLPSHSPLGRITSPENCALYLLLEGQIWPKTETSGQRLELETESSASIWITDFLGQSPKGLLGHSRTLARPSGSWAGTSWAAGPGLAWLLKEAV